MYRRFEPSARIFVNREEYLEWMDAALKRCKGQSVVLHLRGMGGIGKSSLLDYWHSNLDAVIPLDCQVHPDIYSRINILAKGAAQLGVKLPRFTFLWQLRQRFVEGVEPVKKEGQEWIKEVVSAVPFIGQITSVGNAIVAVAKKVAPTLKRKFGTLGDWLENRLGKDHVKKLLEILWKEPEHAQFLFLDAFLEDINNRKAVDDAIVVLMDHFEYVDDEKERWHYNGKPITETALWYVFLGALNNGVGVVASRKPLAPQHTEEIETFELNELDEQSSVELLRRRKIKKRDIQGKIVSVSGGNPYVISTFCDMADADALSLAEVENLRAETLEGVRLKSWKLLFRDATDLIVLLDRAALLPFFNRQVMLIVAPEMKTAQWNRLTSLSFVREREDGNYVLHNLAKELVIGELDDRLPIVTDEMTHAIEKASVDPADYILRGMALSVRALVSERDTMDRMNDIVQDLLQERHYTEALTLLESVRLESAEGRAMLHLLRGKAFRCLRRFVECEEALQNAVNMFRDLEEATADHSQKLVATALTELGYLFKDSNRLMEAETTLEEALSLWEAPTDHTSDNHRAELARTLLGLARLKFTNIRLTDGEAIVRRALQIYDDLSTTKPQLTEAGYAKGSFILGLMLMRANQFKEAEAATQKALRHYEKLAKAQPDAYLIDVSQCLSNLGILNVRQNNFSKAEIAYREAVNIRRDLAKQSPQLYLPNLARSLGRLAFFLSFYVKQLPESENAYREALGIIKKLIDTEPDVYLKDYANYQGKIATLYTETGRPTHAQEAFQDALSIQRDLVEKAPEFHRLELVRMLIYYSIFLRWIGRYDDAEIALREALETTEEVAQQAQTSLWPIIAEVTGLNGLANLYRDTARLADAMGLLQKALKTSKPLKALRSNHQSILHAIVLNNYAIILRKQEELGKAEKSLREAIILTETLSKEIPEFTPRFYAPLLNNLAIILRLTGQLDEAHKTIQQSIEIKRGLVTQSPDMANHSLALSLNTFAIVLAETNHLQQSRNAFHEALQIQETLFQKIPDMSQSSTYLTLANIAFMQKRTGESVAATDKIVKRLKKKGASQDTDRKSWADPFETLEYI
ncbi:MAG: tetratricopeptide repeat protein [Candidatus Hodarchaeota archaeon]